MEFKSVKFEDYGKNKPWFKRPRFYALPILMIVIGISFFRLGSIRRDFSLDNPPWWSVFANIFSFDRETEIDPNPMPEPEFDRLDILVLGIRGGSQEEIEKEGGLLADALTVISVDRSTKKAAMISIPRDLYIDVLGVKGKINQIYERGLEQKEGVELAKKIVSKITATYIDKAVVFDFQAFKELVDELGGIDIYLAKPFSEPAQWGYEFSLSAGQNHLNGDQALYYVRSRFSTSDFDRAKRQQEVMVALKNKILGLGLLANPFKVAGIFSSLKNNILTDFQIWDLNDFIALAKSFDSKSPIKRYVITTENLLYETRNGSGEYILLPKGDNYDGIKSLFQDIFAETKPLQPT